MLHKQNPKHMSSYNRTQMYVHAFIHDTTRAQSHQKSWLRHIKSNKTYGWFTRSARSAFIKPRAERYHQRRLPWPQTDPPVPGSHSSRSSSSLGHSADATRMSSEFWGCRAETGRQSPANHSKIATLSRDSQITRYVCFCAVTPEFLSRGTREQVLSYLVLSYSNNDGYVRDDAIFGKKNT